MHPQLYGQSLWVRKHGGRVHRGHVRARCNGGWTSTVSYTYAPNTYDLASVNVGSYTTAYTWFQGRLTQVSASSASKFSYSYKPNSDLLETTTYLDGTATVSRVYDAADRLISVANNVGATSVSRFLYELDSTGRRIRRTHADASYIDYGYDSYDQLINASKTNSANGAADAAYQYSYEYDKVGNRLHEDSGAQDLDGTFNPLNQLTHLKFAGKLDVLGNLSGTNLPFSVKVDGEEATLYNSTNFLGGSVLNPGSNTISIVSSDASTNLTEKLLTAYAPPTNPEQFSYDLNGNLISDGYRNFTWNEENRLTSIETVAAAVPAANQKKSEFVYDGQGRRAQKTDYSSWNGTNYTTTNVTTFVWDGWNLIAEYSDTPTPPYSFTNFYIWGLDLSQSLQGAGGIGGLLARFTLHDSQATQHLYCYDGNGNVVNVLDETGAVVATYSYDPYGNAIVATGPMAEENPYRFSTKYTDDESGLLYYGYRYYSPSLGRWLSRDPIGELGFHCIAPHEQIEEILEMRQVISPEIERLRKLKKRIVTFLNQNQQSSAKDVVRLKWILQDTERKLRRENQIAMNRFNMNFYLFARNNPISHIDPLGLSCFSDCFDACLHDKLGPAWGPPGCIAVCMMCGQGNPLACSACAACIGWDVGYAILPCGAHCGASCLGDPCYEYSPGDL